jgi:hypothetical protein
LDDRPFARLSRELVELGTCRVALAFSPAKKKARGFLCYAPFAAAVVSAAIVPAKIGYTAWENATHMSFAAKGGSYAELATQSQTNTALYGFLSPLTVDPSFMLQRVAHTWRQNDYELYAWEQFPDILFFDTRDYAVQEAFFNRLAFFAEKKEYRGTLATDRDMQGQHGFNAHDYRPETLAAFFSLAAEQQFSLNKHENLLREILLANGVIVEDETISSTKYKAGKGAVLSISQESADYLRRQFIVHEGLHGLFFTHAEFRDYVQKVYNETDPKSIEFLLGYFDVTPSLAYDITDSYLVQTEFMSYLLQQPVSAVSSYFTDRIAGYIYINRYHPDLVQYIKATRAQGLVEAAQKMSDYLEREWGIAAGRVWKKD